MNQKERFLTDQARDTYNALFRAQIRAQLCSPRFYRLERLTRRAYLRLVRRLNIEAVLLTDFLNRDHIRFLRSGPLAAPSTLPETQAKPWVGDRVQLALNMLAG